MKEKYKLNSFLICWQLKRSEVGEWCLVWPFCACFTLWPPSVWSTQFTAFFTDSKVSHHAAACHTAACHTAACQTIQLSTASLHLLHLPDPVLFSTFHSPDYPYWCYSPFMNKLINCTFYEPSLFFSCCKPLCGLWTMAFKYYSTWESRWLV